LVTDVAGGIRSAREIEVLAYGQMIGNKLNQVTTLKN